MKKLVLAAAVLLGGIAASQAGVSINIGFGHPFPKPVIISRPAPVCPTPVVVAPACRTPVVVAPPVCRDEYVRPVYVPRYGHGHPSYTSHGHSSGHPGYRPDWNRHDRGHDRSDHRGGHRDDHRDNHGHDRGGWYSQNR